MDFSIPGDWFCPNCDDPSEHGYETSNDSASSRMETDFFDSSESSRSSPAPDPTTLPDDQNRSGSDDEYEGNMNVVLPSSLVSTTEQSNVHVTDASDQPPIKRMRRMLVVADDRTSESEPNMDDPD
jgi:hypothetical protein